MTAVVAPTPTSSNALVSTNASKTVADAVENDVVTIAPTSRTSRWLFSLPMDLFAFGGSACLAMVLVWIGWSLGLLQSDTPEWTWITAVLMVDVAHVYATGFRVYFISSELHRRPWLYLLTPLLGYVIGVSVYSESELWFWRLLAYIAVFHFVRQQAGWVSLYRSKVGESRGGWIDFSTIYAATLWPLLWWHDHLPRGFWWFRENDFFESSSAWSDRLEPIYWLVLGVYSVKSIATWFGYGRWNPGKDLVVVSTVACWYIGIVYLNSDFAFTVTNVLIHGIPYMVLVYWLGAVKNNELVSLADSSKTAFEVKNTSTESNSSLNIVPRWGQYLCILWMLAYAEEYFWDRGLWHERPYLFGTPWELQWEGLRTMLVPLLAVPQLTHYILDGFIWKRRTNPEVSSFTEQ